MKGNLVARSVLFCPTDKISMIERALGLKISSDILADVVILDLEDSVSPVMKAKARENVLAIMKTIESMKKEQAAAVLPIVAVRINCAATTPWGIDDISLLSKIKADAVVVPKVNSLKELEFSVQKMNVGSAPFPLWAMIETAKGVVNASEIANSEFVQTLVFGSNDLTKDLKAFRTDNREPLLYSMSKCILAARAAEKFVIDGVFMDIKDKIKFRAECLAGRNLGFDGIDV